MRRILIVEDEGRTRNWLRELAQEAFPSSRVDEGANQREGVKLVSSCTYDLALIDLNLPDGSGLEVLRKVKAGNCDTLCVVTTIMGEDFHIVSALTAGADGYLLKEQEKAVLVKQLKQLAEGVPALSPTVARRIMDHFRFTGPCIEAECKLTPREVEVLGLIARGFRIQDAACALSVAESTIATHVKSIYRKLGIGSRAEAAMHAAKIGLLTPEPKSESGAS